MNIRLKCWYLCAATLAFIILSSDVYGAPNARPPATPSGPPIWQPPPELRKPPQTPRPPTNGSVLPNFGIPQRSREAEAAFWGAVVDALLDCKPTPASPKNYGGIAPRGLPTGPGSQPGDSQKSPSSCKEICESAKGTDLESLVCPIVTIRNDPIPPEPQKESQ